MLQPCVHCGRLTITLTCASDLPPLSRTPNSEMPPPLYTDEEITSFIRACNHCQAPMTFNVGIYQDGTLAPASIAQLQRVKGALAAP